MTVKSNFYSVPTRAGTQVEARVHRLYVEVWHGGRLIPCRLACGVAGGRNGRAREARAITRLLHEAKLPRMKTLDAFEFDRSSVSVARLRTLVEPPGIVRGSSKARPVLLALYRPRQPLFLHAPRQAARC